MEDRALPVQHTAMRSKPPGLGERHQVVPSRTAGGWTRGSRGPGAGEFIQRDIVDVGRRKQQLEGGAALPPGSRRDRILTKIPVASVSCSRVVPRGMRSRSPTAVRTALSSSAMPLCQTGKLICRVSGRGAASSMTSIRNTSPRPPAFNRSSELDVLVVGGGLSGLGAALGLVRACRSVLVVDAGHPRKAPAAHSIDISRATARPRWSC